MKALVVTSDVVGVGSRCRENTWEEVFKELQLGIYVSNCEIILKLSYQPTENNVLWVLDMRKPPCRNYIPLPNKKKREIGRLFYKRQKYKF